MAVFLVAVSVTAAMVSGAFDFAFMPEPFFVVALFIFPIIFYIFDLYYPYKKFKPALTFFEIVFCVTFGGGILAALSYFDRDFSWGRRPFLLTLGCYVFFVMAVRMVYDFVFRSRFLDKPTLILGTGDLAKTVWYAIEATVHSGLRMVGVIAEGSEVVESGEKWKKLPLLGNIKQVRDLIQKQSIELVVLAIDEDKVQADARWLGELSVSGAQVTSGIYLLERLTGTLPEQAMNSHTILSLVAQVRARPYLKLKRLLDACTASLLLVLTAPVWILTILGLSFEGAHKVFFVQDRVGLSGKKFRLYKFRSMTEDQVGKPMVTGMGRWLRKYRIDELPQLVNVLKGDMSLVGPRPEIDYFVKRSINKIPMYEAVFAIKPGLTGWAQVKFRYTISVKDYHEKFRYNLYYLKHMSFMLDVLIIFKTIRIVLLGLGR